MQVFFKKSAILALVILGLTGGFAIAQDTATDDATDTATDDTTDEGAEGEGEDGDAEGEDAEPASNMPPPSPGIVFHKPPTSSGLSNRFQIRTEALSLVEDANLKVALMAANLNVTAVDGAANTYKIELDGEDVLLTGLTGSSGLPDTMQAVFADIDASLSDTWNLRAAKDGSLKLTKVVLKDIRLEWGGLSMLGFGRVDVDANGLATGEITLTASPWQQLLNMGLLNGAQSSTLGAMLGQGASGDELTITLNVTQGNVLAGPILLATIPPLVLR